MIHNSYSTQTKLRADAIINMAKRHFPGQLYNIMQKKIWFLPEVTFT